MWIASNAARFEATDPQMIYLERAKLLAPADADLWYACGLQEILQTQEPFRAWDSWRYSLELSDVHLADILDRSAGFLDPPQMLDELLPDRPAILLQAANHLYPDPEVPRQRRPLDSQARQMFVEQALALLQDQPGRLSPAEMHLQAQLLSATDKPAEAIESYRTALLREPRQVHWRLELAQLLRGQHRYEEAQREVTTILGMLPSFQEARSLAQLLASEIASGKTGPGSAPADPKSTDSSAVGP
jgi:tetratricopeptide (TPR) repeat protein